MHRIVVLALHGVVSYDLGVPCLLFGAPRRRDGKPAYRIRVCGEARRVRSQGFDLHVRFGIAELARADTVIVPGIDDLRRRVPPRVLAALRSAAKRGIRIASICTGSFVLAAAGLLDGHKVTTHWLGSDELARRFPRLTVDPNVLFVDEGRIVTSAGASAGLDMCLHLIRRDLGQAAAAAAARIAVAPLSRDGGQAQFIRHEPPTSQTSLARLLRFMEENLGRSLDIATLAKRAGVSPRTLARQFRHQTGTSPAQWITRARVRRAQEILEATTTPIAEVAETVGFASPITFRTRFHQIIGISPLAYRSRFRAGRQARHA